MVRAKSFIINSSMNHFLLFYIDLDVNNNYGIYFQRSDDYLSIWTDTVCIKTGVAIFSFHVLIDLNNIIHIFFSKVVAGVIKFYRVISNDLGVTFETEVEII